MVEDSIVGTGMVPYAEGTRRGDVTYGKLFCFGFSAACGEGLSAFRRFGANGAETRALAGRMFFHNFLDHVSLM